ncbi:MAG: FAD-dependent monooxygenase [Bacteroidetes bacterium]|nr:FAD-dependent monooxygenase [Bacteroidota bacterium]
MKNQVLISGASFAGLTLAYWLHKYGYQVTIVEISKSLRKEGAPIDVRGEALHIAEEMGILEKIKAKEVLEGNEIQMVNAQNETMAAFSINGQDEYLGDIEIFREDLIDILFENIPHDEMEILFNNSIEKIIQNEDNVEVIFKHGEKRIFDFVFGADGTHSVVRRLIFGEEAGFSKFFGEYFAFTEAPAIQGIPNARLIYNEPGKMAMITHFRKTTNVGLIFRSTQLNYDYKNREQHRQILKDHFQGNNSWRIPEILGVLLHSDNLYFDEVCQIHMPAWSNGRVALIGDAAHAASFHTGMGTSLAIQGATILAKELHSNADYKIAFANYYNKYKPYVETVQAKITRGMNLLVPETQEAIQEAYKRFNK